MPPSIHDARRTVPGRRGGRTALVLSLAGALLTACGKDGESGSSGTQGEGGAAPETPEVFEPAAGGVRRLLGAQYVSSVRFLFGSDAADAVSESGVLPGDPTESGYAAIGAAATPPALSDPESWDQAAERIANTVLADPATLAEHVPCVESAPDAACYDELAEGLGRLAFRRPITSEEREWIVGLATEGQALNDDFLTGVKYAVWGITSSPHFLYVVETGEPDPDHPGWNQLTGYELATRLSFFLTNTTPDADLLAAAEAGTLDTPEGIASVAETLLERPAARDTSWRLFREAFQVDGIVSAQKDPALFPEFTASTTIRSALLEEVRLLFEDVVWTRDADVRELYTAGETFLNDELADHYGLPAPPNDWEKVAWPSFEPRSGLLTSGALLATTSHEVTSSPTRRGLWVRERVLCQDTPTADPVPHASLPQPQPGETTATTRETLEALTADSTCQDCHQQIDPIGFALDSFDALGKRRQEDNGSPIDTTGSVDFLGSWSSAPELAELLVQDERTTRCFVLHLLRGSLGHFEAEGEESAIADLTDAFADGGHRLQDLLVRMSASPLFRYVEGTSDDD